MRLVQRVLALSGVMLLAACASAPSSSETGETRNLITAGEMAGMQDQSVYTVIQRLRPSYLHVGSRGAVSVGAAGPGSAGENAGAGKLSGVPVYLDGRELGTAEDLRNVQASRIFEIRYLTASEAAAKFGARSNLPVIALTSR